MMKIPAVMILIFSLVSCALGQIEWTWQNPVPQGNTLIHVTAFSPDSACAVTNTNQVFATTDGGSVWNARESSGALPLFSPAGLFFLNPGTGWAGGGNYVVVGGRARPG